MRDIIQDNIDILSFYRRLVRDLHPDVPEQIDKVLNAEYNSDAIQSEVNNLKLIIEEN